MSFTRIKTSRMANARLGILKSRTGLTPNILSRIGFCLSLEEPGLPNPALYDDQGREFNRFTLTGEWDPLFNALLKERILQDNLNPEHDLLPQFKAHLNRGVMLLYTRVKGLTNLYDLLPTQ